MRGVRLVTTKGREPASRRARIRHSSLADGTARGGRSGSLPSRSGLTNAFCWKQAQRYLVGGVNSPVRSFRAVGGIPFFVDRGKGPYLWDVEGHRYLDLVNSWGALILGHRHPMVVEAIEKALERGTTFGTPTPAEIRLAQAISEAIPSMEQVRFVSSGTEAVMSAIRLARAATGRSKILKFDGAYHGHWDPLLTKAGSGMATLGLPTSPGVPACVTGDTITIPFNNELALKEALGRYRKKLACVLVEPVMANIGVIPPAKNFLATLRRLTQENGILLIFDEVITGFRVAYGGAQRLFGVKPDLTILGKVIGGGFPVGVYGGSRRIMSWVAPQGPVYQAGTLSGHPVAMAAGLATLQELRRLNPYKWLDESGKKIREALISESQKVGVPVVVHQVGGLLTLFFSKGPIENGSQARRSDTRRYARYFHQMLKEGIYLPPSSFEAWFLSTAMGENECRLLEKAHRTSLRAGFETSRGRAGWSCQPRKARGGGVAGGALRRRRATPCGEANPTSPSGCGGRPPSPSSLLLDVSQRTRLRRRSLDPTAWRTQRGSREVLKPALKAIRP